MINNEDSDHALDLGAVQRRYQAALAARPGVEILAAVVTVVADVPALLVEVRRLRAELWAARLRYANLVAAGRATLGAAADGERDPLCYLRDELPPLPPGHPGRRWAGRGWCR